LLKSLSLNTFSLVDKLFKVHDNLGSHFVYALSDSP
jgi:hypothetical protein